MSKSAEGRRRRREGGAHVDVELFVAAEREEELDEEVDAAFGDGSIICRGDKTGVTRLLEGGVPMNGTR